MKITLIGMALIPLCIYFFLFNHKNLFKLAVFSIPFTGTAFFILQSAQLANDGRGLGIRVSIVLFLLLFILGGIKAAKLSKFHIPFQARGYLILMLILALVIMLSQLTPLYISGSFNVVDSYGEALIHAKEIPLYYDIQWATQAAYFVFGCLVSMFVVIHLSTPQLLTSTIRIYLYSTIFISIWGLTEWLLYQLNIPYPYYLFNHNSTSYGGSTVLSGFVRITSAALEPSILSQQLISALPFFLYREEGIGRVLPPFLHKLGGTAIVLVLLLSTSATAYASLLFVFVLYLFSMERITYKLVLTRLMIAAVFIAIVLVLSGSIYDLVMHKLGSYSGKERMMSVTYAITYFTNYPVLGVGWGVMPSWDLVFCILAGAGLLGFSVMFILFGRIILTLLKTQTEDLDFGYMKKSSLLSFTSLLAASQLSGFIYHSLYFWFILGFVVAVIVHIGKLNTGVVATRMLTTRTV